MNSQSWHASPLGVQTLRRKLLWNPIALTGALAFVGLVSLLFALRGNDYGAGWTILATAWFVTSVTVLWSSLRHLGTVNWSGPTVEVMDDRLRVFGRHEIRRVDLRVVYVTETPTFLVLKFEREDGEVGAIVLHGEWVSDLDGLIGVLGETCKVERIPRLLVRSLGIKRVILYA